MFIHIDENELLSLTMLCGKIFGVKNILTMVWKKTNERFDKNRKEKPLESGTRRTHEYVLLCFKDRESTTLNPIKQPVWNGKEYEEREKPLETVIDDLGTTSSAKDELAYILGDRTIFSTPKPVKLIKEFIRAGSNKNSIILDFFAGSGTTGHAVMDLNKEDGGNTLLLRGGKCLLRTDGQTTLTGNDDDRRTGGTNTLAQTAHKVKQTGSIQNVQLGILPLHGNQRGGNRYLAADLLGVKVTDGVAIRDLAQTVRLIRQVIHRLSQAGLTRAGMTGQGHVTDGFCIVVFHRCTPFLLTCPPPLAKIHSQRTGNRIFCTKKLNKTRLFYTIILQQNRFDNTFL